ncbi:MAG: anthranilate synthase component I family protein [Deltaproteobacteria bacterium]|nr:MAG: anthranilate synthase component I family protein [Deltaproteobacteria bacterium]
MWTEVLADLETPVSAFLKLAPTGPAFLLESVQGGERWAAYSFLGWDPLLTLVGGRDGLSVRWASGEAARLDADDPLRAVEAVLGRLRLATPQRAGRRPQLVAGAVGYLGYDLVRAFERLPERRQEDRALPVVNLLVPGALVVFDTLRQVLRLVRNVHVRPGDDPEALWWEARERLEAMGTALGAAAPPRRRSYEPPAGEGADVSGSADPARGGSAAASFEALVPRARFESMVRRVVDYVHAGDCIQTVVSQRFTAPRTVDVFDVYRALRTTNPSPYMYYLRLMGSDVDREATLEVAGASPEVLVRLEGDEVVVRPIAGTRPRSPDPEVDQRLEAELRSDPKEIAEHVMLVDLGRNDVGRIARPGTVRVVEDRVVERYSHVMHLVSEVRGRLREDATVYDAIRATFPAGTLTGAPKVRAMEIIDALEAGPRELYGGAVGYLGLDGSLDLCICIRTLVAHGDRIWCQSGAGVVADSDPAREYEETLNKARSVFRAVELARRGLVLTDATDRPGGAASEVPAGGVATAETTAGAAGAGQAAPAEARAGAQPHEAAGTEKGPGESGR